MSQSATFLRMQSSHFIETIKHYVECPLLKHFIKKQEEIS